MFFSPSMFGGGGSGGLFGLGGKPSAENANKNVFGSGFGSGSTDQNPQAQSNIHYLDL